MVWTSANGPKCPVSPADRCDYMTVIARHNLKCWTPYYHAILSGEKKFDVRWDDRGFQKGDFVVLEQYELGRGYVCDPDDNIPYSFEKKIEYILTGGAFGIEPGYVVLGF